MSRSLVAAMLCASLALPALACLPRRASAQAPKVAKDKATKDKASKDKPAPPEDIKFDTKDGWTIHATYYPGKLKKQAVPFIMLHGWEGQRGDFDSLAKYLQGLGHAVLCPDLRGHGQSNVRPGAAGKTIEKPDDLSNNDVKAMLFDVEECKKFLRDKNNEGECNIETLSLVAADFSCITALKWAALDWSVANLPSYKQGQDAKLVVMLSPEQSRKGISLNEALTHPAVKNRLALMIVVGRDDMKSFADARKINTRLENFRPEMKKEDVKLEDRTLFFIELNTNLSGTKLLNEALRVKERIALAAKLRLLDKQEDYAWTERKRPGEE